MITDANRRRWVLVAMTGGLPMILLDTTVVTVALPSIQDDLDLSQTELQWVVNAYLLSLAALVPLAGRLADVFDRVRVFNVGVVVFAVSSATCALAVDEWSLIISRAAEGVGPHGTSGRRTAGARPRPAGRRRRLAALGAARRVGDARPRARHGRLACAGACAY